jgi:hypothetical protein
LENKFSDSYSDSLTLFKVILPFIGMGGKRDPNGEGLIVACCTLSMAGKN